MATDPVLTSKHQNLPRAKIETVILRAGRHPSLALSEEDEASSLELSPDITAELNERGELIGIGILNACAFVQETFAEGT